MKRLQFFFFTCILLNINCSENKTTNPAEPDTSWEDLELKIDVPKWHDGHTAAVSITYDARWNGNPLVTRAADEALDRGLPISFELVTSNYIDSPEFIIEMREELIPKGISFYGHGHKHDDFDSKSFEYCLASFELCYNYMRAWGLNPKAYSYPHGKGFESTTKLANRLAGFICARGLTFLSNPNYICADNETEPRDWHYLPTISVAKEYLGYINDHAQMSDVLNTNLEKTSWIIIMYHSIGFPGDWGYYPFDDYLMDLDQIAANDFWCASMDKMACYIKERNGFEFRAKEIESTNDLSEYEVLFFDRLDNEVYDQPLTLDITFDTEIDIEKIQIELPDYETTEFEVTDNRLRLYVIPDEKKYRMTLFKRMKDKG